MAQLQWPTPPAMAIDVNKDYAVSIETSRGTIELALYPKHAPQTVNNFVFLAKKGYYDWVKFHRVIADFMIQTGDPTATGLGCPGYTFSDEVKNNPLKHERGVISMARTSDPNSAGSQFFIMVAAAPHLDGQYAAFGRVISGMDVVDRIVAPAHLSDVNYTYDAAGNVTRIADTPLGGTADTQCFTYDYLRRLT